MSEGVEVDRAAVRDALVEDLEAEQHALDVLLRTLDAPAWAAVTPAPGWTIQDQIVHVAFFDRAATLSMTDPEAFGREAARAAEDYDAYHDGAIAAGRSLEPGTLLEDWCAGAAAFRSAARAADPTRRCDWYVTEMGVVSLVSARLMETWAHAQDVRDTVGAPPEAADRLRHIAHLACRAMPYAFVANGLAVPGEPVRVELTLPSGGAFVYGPPAAPDRVTGSVVDLCLVATQRRHVDDTELTATGDVAEAWLPIAQAFAGPPGPGRRPGQFA